MSHPTTRNQEISRYLPGMGPLVCRHFGENGHFGQTDPSAGSTSTRHHLQITHANQVISRRHEYELEIQFVATNEPALAQTTDGFHPAKTILDALMRCLTDLITRVGGGASLDRRRMVDIVPGYLRRDFLLAHVCNKALHVIDLIRVQRDTTTLAERIALIRSTAAARSALPVARVTVAAPTSPWRFPIYGSYMTHIR